MYCHCGHTAHHTIDNTQEPPLHYYKCGYCGNIMDRHYDNNDEWHKQKRRKEERERHRRQAAAHSVSNEGCA